MPRGLRGERRPRVVIRNTVATEQINQDIPTPESEGKDPAAVALGRKGGKARAEGLTKKRRKEIAQHAARARWNED